MTGLFETDSFSIYVSYLTAHLFPMTLTSLVSVSVLGHKLKVFNKLVI